MRPAIVLQQQRRGEEALARGIEGIATGLAQGFLMGQQAKLQREAEAQRIRDRLGKQLFLDTGDASAMVETGILTAEEAPMFERLVEERQALQQQRAMDEVKHQLDAERFIADSRLDDFKSTYEDIWENLSGVGRAMVASDLRYDGTLRPETRQYIAEAVMQSEARQAGMYNLDQNHVLWRRFQGGDPDAVSVIETMDQFIGHDDILDKISRAVVTAEVRGVTMSESVSEAVRDVVFDPGKIARAWDTKAKIESRMGSLESQNTQLALRRKELEKQRETRRGLSDEEKVEFSSILGEIESNARQLSHLKQKGAIIDGIVSGDPQERERRRELDINRNINQFFDSLNKDYSHLHGQHEEISPRELLNKVSGESARISRELGVPAQEVAEKMIERWSNEYVPMPPVETGWFGREKPADTHSIGELLPALPENVELPTEAEEPVTVEDEVRDLFEDADWQRQYQQYKLVSSIEDDKEPTVKEEEEPTPEVTENEARQRAEDMASNAIGGRFGITQEEIDALPEDPDTIATVRGLQRQRVAREIDDNIQLSRLSEIPRSERKFGMPVSVPRNSSNPAPDIIGYYDQDGKIALTRGGAQWVLGVTRGDIGLARQIMERLDITTEASSHLRQKRQEVE